VLKAKYNIQFTSNVQNQRGALLILKGRVSLVVSSDRAEAARVVSCVFPFCVSELLLRLRQVYVPYGGLAGDCGDYHG